VVALFLAVVPSLAAAEAPRVIGVAVEGSAASSGRVAIDSTLVVKLDSAEALSASASCSDLRLVLNGRALDDLDPTRCDGAKLTFALRRIDRSSASAWLALVDGRQALFNVITPVDVSVGVASTGEVFPSAVAGAKAARFELASALTLIVSGVFALLALGGLLMLGWRGGALRDPRSTLEAAQRPYSLSRVQMAWWFFLVLISFLYVSLLTGQGIGIPTGILALMGIATGTVAGDQMVDTPTPRAAQAVTKGFWLDLVTTVDGEISLSKFQALVWTLVIGGIFVVDSLNTVTISALDGSLVALLGVSSGSYVGLKAGGNSGEAVERDAAVAPAASAGVASTDDEA
jgi:hypothetical protein